MLLSCLEYRMASSLKIAAWKGYAFVMNSIWLLSIWGILSMNEETIRVISFRVESRKKNLPSNRFLGAV